MEFENRKEVVESEYKPSGHRLLGMSFGGESDDGTAAETGNEEFHDHEQEEETDERPECHGRNGMVEIDLDVEESGTSSIDIAVDEVDLVDDQLDIEENLEERTEETPTLQRGFRRGDSPCLSDDFSGSQHGEKRGKETSESEYMIKTRIDERTYQNGLLRGIKPKFFEAYRAIR